MSDFEKRYAALNAAQKLAVDTIDGPVMVVAGPGTGKTELLSMRVANILRKVDVLPQNILCLTYTESGAHAMRQRLAGLIGSEAYKVAIHTFHSFGTEIINRNPEYFYNGAHFRPADELSSYEVLKQLFEKLSHSNPLSSKVNEEFTYLRDVQTTISDLKKSGLTSDELTEILKRNDAFCRWFQPKLAAVFAERLSKKAFEPIRKLAESIDEYPDEPYELITYEPLSDLVQSSLQLALESADAEGSTKPISAWKREWCEKQGDGELTLKAVKRSEKLRAVATLYYDYLVAMQQRSLFDFDDMILRTIHALEVFHELRLNLQEQYQYILVDEFQDTNDGQMRLLWNLTNNAVLEGTPNIMVVGDDDQAIYRFQGANLSNILDFTSLYRDVAVITLRDNYRSAEPILALARQTILQASERLERSVAAIDKTLQPHHNPSASELSFASFEDEGAEYSALAESIALLRKTDPEKSIAVIARHHKQLQAALPYLQEKQLPLSYDRRDNVLEIAPIRFLELLSRTVMLLSEQRLDEVNGLLPELLSHPAWDIPQRDLWALSVESYKGRQFWLETMLSKEGQLCDIAEWLIFSAHLATHEPLEYILDHLTGTMERQAPESPDQDSDETQSPQDGSDEGYRSPLRDYFFSHDLLESQPALYISYLDGLSSIRRRLRDYRPENQLFLKDFIYFVDRCRELKLSIQGSGHIKAEHAPVELLTAHRSKGLEFDTVFIIGLSDTIWGESSRSRGRLVAYPQNLPIGISGDSSDEHIRLLFVALTRAKTNLRLSTHQINSSGKSVMPVSYLSHIDTSKKTAAASPLERVSADWKSGMGSAIDHSMTELLADTLSTYKLSATHLCNFLDVSRGGPELFLLQNLLRFPQAMSPSAAFGSAIHATLQRAHAHLTATGKKRPIEDLLGDFDISLSEYQLASDQHEYFAKKGADVLNTFLASRYDSFSPDQKVEQRFAASSDTLGDVRLSGAIDLIDIDSGTKSIVVTDYKTGKSTSSWRGKTEYEKIKLHHYKQQLMFYKILIESSHQYAGYAVEKGIIEYIEPDSSGTINRIELTYDDAELTDFKRLLLNVWQRIQQLDFSLQHPYEPTLKGIEAFEAELLADS